MNINLLGKDGKWHLIDSGTVAGVLWNDPRITNRRARLLFSTGEILELDATTNSVLQAIADVQRQAALIPIDLI